MSQNHAVALAARLIGSLHIGADVRTQRLHQFAVGANAARGKNHCLGIDAIQTGVLALDEGAGHRALIVRVELDELGVESQVKLGFLGMLAEEL